jgi:hypothetical protein
MWVVWNLVSVCLETVLVLVLDRCIVCTKRTIGSEIASDAPDGTPRCTVRLDIVLILKQDRCMVCAKRIIGSKIVLDAPDGTPR